MSFIDSVGGGGGSATFIGLTDVPGSFSGSALKILRVNAGETALEFTTLPGGGDALKADPLSQFASTTSLQLAGVISDETGSGALVFGTDPTFTTRINVPEIKATGSGGIDLHNNSGTQIAIFGAGGGVGASINGTTNIGSASADYLQIAGGTGATTLTAIGSSTNIDITVVPKGTGLFKITGNLQISGLTASTILITDASKNVISASTSTYPSLTELSYVKGVTSAIQTQINSKEPSITAGTSSQYWRGDKTFQTLDSLAVIENTNLYFTTARVLATTLSGLSITGSTIASTDTILAAFGKLQNQINGILGGAIYQGVWNASTNSPSLASGTGTKGYYYVVSVAGSTNLDGITDWKVGDWAIFNGTTWDKVDNTDAVSSVNGAIGAITIEITGTTNRISIAGGTGLTPTIDISASYVGQSSITTLGTITTGAWQGTKIGLAYGGTNADLSTTGGASQVLKQTTAGGNITVAQLTASDLSNGVSGSGNVVLATSPTLVTPNIGVATATEINIGHASDTTLSRVSAGVLAIEGVNILTVAGGTLTGNLTLGENTSIALDPAGSADGKYNGITIAGTAGYAQTYGDLVYLDPTDSRWEKCDANSASGADGDSRGIIGIVVVAGASDGSACTILLKGIIRADAAFPTLTVNNPIYVSETAGAVTQTQPTTTDAVIRIIGFALTADEMYFNPENDYITHT